MPNIPLHPMVVHFPIVLSVALPFIVMAALWIARGRARPARIWAVPLAIIVVLFGSAFVATRTGEAEEERVEKVVPENVLHAHEEAAERFLVIVAVVGLIAVAGLAAGGVGSAARAVTIVGSVIIVFAGFQVGKAGGELVYEHNAAAAYAQGGKAEKAAGDMNEESGQKGNNNNEDHDDD